MNTADLLGGLKDEDRRLVARFNAELDTFLTSREAAVLRLRRGAGQDQTLAEVGRLFGVTKEFVRQIEARALRKLRHYARMRS